MQPSRSDRVEIATEGMTLWFDPDLGMITAIRVEDSGHVISPLHTAPWVAEGEAMPDGAPPHLVALGGDFFCAPFGASERGAPLHGWTANSGWDTVVGVGALQAVLRKTVQAAEVSKALRLHDGHPFVYQSHVFKGGEGRVPVANHANVSVADGAHIRTSLKRHWETPTNPVEDDPARGRSALGYPKRGQAVAFPDGNGGTVDLRWYPWGTQHEDFVIGIEAPGHELGWTAVTRPATGDAFLSLRNPRQLPMTMLWHSNGGRDYAPWSGRHRGCLGVEEGAAAHLLSLSDEDVLVGPGSVDLGAGVDVRHVTGAVHWPSGEPVAEVAAGNEHLRIVGEGGSMREVPYDTDFLRDAA